MVKGILYFEMTKGKGKELNFYCQSWVRIICNSSKGLNSRTVFTRTQGNDWDIRKLIWNKIILNNTWYLTTFLFKTLTRQTPSGSNLPECECYWRFPVHFCPFTLFLCKILIHFFSLPWAIENTLGPGGLFKPSNISLMEYTVKLCYWFGNKREVILKPYGIKWEPTNKIQQDEGKWYSPKAQFCIPLLGADIIILGLLGINRVTESKWLHR